jgi:hypothetical protein
MPADVQNIAGCRRSRANALKHGLSARILLTDDSDRLNQLIALLAPECDDKEVWHAARRAAEARLYCERVSRARSETIKTLIETAIETGKRWDGTTSCSGNGNSDRLETIHSAQASDRLVRYERRAAKQLEIALENLQLLIARRKEQVAST